MKSTKKADTSEDVSVRPNGRLLQVCYLRPVRHLLLEHVFVCCHGDDIPLGGSFPSSSDWMVHILP